MLRQLRIRTRLFLLLILPITLMSLVCIILLMSTVSDTLRNAEQRELAEVFENVNAGIAAQGRLGQAMSALVAGIPDVQAAFAAGDRERLSELFVPGFKQLKSEFGIRQFQFHLPPATSFLRVHKPAKFGDDLSSFRKTVVSTNDERRPIAGPEVGVAGLGVRGMVPVYHDGQHIGSVEFGLSMGQKFFDDFSAEHDVGLALYLLRGARLDRLASTLGDTDPINSERLSSVIGGDPLIIETELNGKPVSIYARQVADYSGSPMGVMLVAQDRSFYLTQVADMRNLIILLLSAIVLLSAVIVWFVTQVVVTPLQQTAESLIAVAEGEGDLSSRLDSDGKDEVAALSRAFNTFIQHIQKTVREAVSATSTLSQEVDALSHTAQHTNYGMQKQQEETVQIATAMTEMSATVREVAENTARTAHSAREAAGQAQDGQVVVQQTISAINNLASDVETAGSVVKRVEDGSAQISTVLDVIRGFPNKPTCWP